MLTVYVLFSDAGGANFLLALLALLPLYGFAKDWVSPFFAGAGERILPKLADGEAMRKTRVLVSIATFLCGEEKSNYRTIGIIAGVLGVAFGLCLALFM